MNYSTNGLWLFHLNQGYIDGYTYVERTSVRYVKGVRYRANTVELGSETLDSHESGEDESSLPKKRPL